jgi:hypothetical protein
VKRSIRRDSVCSLATLLIWQGKNVAKRGGAQAVASGGRVRLVLDSNVLIAGIVSTWFSAGFLQPLADRSLEHGLVADACLVGDPFGTLKIRDRYAN